MSVFISLSPNTEADDVSRALAMLLQPWRWHDQNVVDRVAARIQMKFPHSQVVLTSSGRSALYHLLQAYGIGAGDEVIVQAFTCVAVPAAVQWTGAKPVFADIDETYNLDPRSVEARITPATKAIIVQHTFGIPANLAELKRIAEQRNILLIEDCAHSLGATYHGKPLGAWGDAAILSFGRDKTLSSVFGGAIVVRDTDVAQRVQQNIRALPLPPNSWVAQQLVHPVIFALVKPLYFVAGLGKVLLVAAQRAGVLSKAVEAGEKNGGQPSHLHYGFSPGLALLLEQQWQKLDHYTARRREIAAQYAKVLPLPSQLQSALQGGSWLRFPIEVANPAQVRNRARAAGMLLGDWYDSVVAPRDVDVSRVGYQAGLCPRAERAAERMINLPTYPTMSNEQAKRVINFMKENA